MRNDINRHPDDEDSDLVVRTHQYSPTNNSQSMDLTDRNRLSIDKPNKPLGVAFFGSFFKFDNVTSKRISHKVLLLCVTFISYSCLHMARRPLSIVKNVLNRNCSGVLAITLYDQNEEYVEILPPTSIPPNSNATNWCDWPPFDNDATANQLLAILDSAFLFAYAFFMFFSGFLAERCNLRYFLSGGLILTGLLLYAFGLAFYLNIHSMTFFIIIQILSGAAQTAGWPSVVTCIGNWFEPSSRGAVFGFWNANTNLGNILGATIAGYFVEKAWGLSFIVPGFILMSSSILVFLFLVPRPEDVGLLPFKAQNSLKIDEHNEHRSRGDALTVETQPSTSNRSPSRRKLPRYDGDNDSNSEFPQESDETILFDNSEHSPLMTDTNNLTSPHHDNEEFATVNQAVSFWTCLKIPGVIEFSLCLGFAKLVSYTFLYWLPRYITQATDSNSEQSAYLSVPFDLGGILGAIAAGYVSDKSRKSGLVCAVMLILAIPSIYLFQNYAPDSHLHNIYLQLMTGFFVNGPHSLITTAVSADLGGRVKSGKAMATVTAIIDGTGSIGAAIGPLFAGYVSDSGWGAVFLMLMLSDLIALFCLARVVFRELGIGR